MLRGAFYQKSVDNNRGKRKIDQDIPQGFTAFLRDFLSPVQGEAKPAQQKHLQNLPDQELGNFHAFMVLSFIKDKASVNNHCRSEAGL